MRPCTVWTAIITSLAALTDQVAADPVLSAYGEEEFAGAPVAEAFNQSLANNELFRRDGVFEKMRTCLLVAADKNAIGLWEENPTWHRMEAPPLSQKLRDLRPSEKGQDGFGTIWACAQILKSWYTRMSTSHQSGATEDNDGRIEHGAIVIDFRFGDITDQSDPHGNRYGSVGVDPNPLVRLLSSPRLLPSWAFGGIVIRHATINGTLLLNNLHLSLPLAFVNVRFVGSEYKKRVFAIDGSVEDAAISIIHSRLTDHILISNSEICGSVIINNSYFGEEFEWRNVKQRALKAVVSESKQYRCANVQQEKDNRGFFINGSEFAQGLEFSESSLGFFHAYGSSIDRFDSYLADFGSTLEFGDNDFGSIVIYKSLAARNAINYNRIRNDFFIEGPVERENEIESITINSNRIGGGIGFLNFQFEDKETNKEPRDPSQPSHHLPTHLSFESNHVGNGSIICVPENWSGTLSLDGSSYNGTLGIGLTAGSGRDKKADSGKEKGEPPRDDKDTLSCSGEFDPHIIQRNLIDNEYCEGLDGRPEDANPKVVKTGLQAAKIGTLIWQFPLSCKYRWTGFGLEYRLWRYEYSASARSQQQPIEGSWLRRLLAWRTTLWSHDAAPLDTMSRYLIENGAYVRSRELLLEAKRLNYAPNCRPDTNAMQCACHVVLVEMLGFEPKKGQPGCFWPFSQETKSSDDTGNQPNGTSAAFTVAAAKADDDITSDKVDDSPKDTIERIDYGNPDTVISKPKSVLMLILLWPGGYGAEPERAILLLFIAMVIFYCLYLGYSTVLRDHLLFVPRYVQNIVTIKPLWFDDTSWKSAYDKHLAEPGETQFAGMVDLPWPSDAYWRNREMKMKERLAIVQERLLPMVDDLIGKSMAEDVEDDLRKLRARLGRFGNTETLGFSHFDSGKMPKQFTRWLYSFDTMMPFIDLHAYGSYYPESGWIRAFSVVQHFLGWWLITVFIASAAIL